MIEVFEFFFDDFWHFVGGLIYIAAIGGATVLVFEAGRSIKIFTRKKKKR